MVDPLTAWLDASIETALESDKLWREQLSKALNANPLVLRELTSLLTDDPSVIARIDKALLASEYLRQSWIADVSLLLDNVNPRNNGSRDYLQHFDALSSVEVDSEEKMMRHLRVYRRAQMCRIIFRDLNRLSLTLATTADLSALARASIEYALRWHQEDMAVTNGYAYLQENSETRQTLSVLGMGKLGANELNLSSDIDLIFTYASGGETRGGRKPLDHQQYFTRLGQRVIKALDAVTVDGFVFRVDMRLRPYGQSGALALSFDAMEEYYQDQGRDWERYAMIKAAPVAGDVAAAEVLMQQLQPFVYRKYLDFSAIESLRKMKVMIRAEVKRRGLQNNVKLGVGGIREVEFIAQTFQLIRGGQDAQLRQRELLSVLTHLKDSASLPDQAVTELIQAYLFLRDVEHVLQAWRDEQTQELPADDEGQHRVAIAMGFADWAGFYPQLCFYQACVAKHFADLIAPVDVSETNDELDDSDLLWPQFGEDEVDAKDLAAIARRLGFDDPDETATALLKILTAPNLRNLQPVGRERLDSLMPRLLRACLDTENPSQTLSRLVALILAILRRSSYMVLLLENPNALNQLIRLCSASPMVSESLAEQPVLLDELLDEGALYSPPDKAQLRDDLQQHLLRIEPDDEEGLMEALRYFKLAHGLRVAAAEIAGTLPLMKVSDYLSWIAEVILDAVVYLSWHNLTQRYGEPSRNDNDADVGLPFIVVAYGKLGGIELGHNSDLDLVFVHDTSMTGSTDGEKSVDNAVFFARLGQRIIHMFNTQTRLGQLYEVDMRLRPSGNSGLLVTTLKAFEHYQFNDAWTWEHQALVRARVVAGGESLTQAFVSLRQRVLQQTRELPQLKADVRSMRQKMVEQLAPTSDKAENFDIIHLKQSRGAIVDIEFMVQYAVLAWSANVVALCTYTDNIRILEQLAQAELIDTGDAQLLIEAYQVFRKLVHKRALQGLDSEVADATVIPYCEQVLSVWQKIFED